MGSSGCNLIERAVAGDRQALSALLEAHTSALRRHLADKIPLRWQAVLSIEDVLQETFTDAFLGIGEFRSREDGAFAVWLNTIATRNVVNVIKLLEAEKRGGKRQRIGTPDRNASRVALYEFLAATQSTPSRRLGRREACEALERAMRALPETHRRVVEMYDLEELGMDDVSRTLGCSRGAAHGMRRRAHASLVAQLGNESKYLTTT